MAKDGNKKKTRIPKQVAGIKVPKKLRKAGKKAVKLASDPIVSEVVAAALLSAAAALREGGKRDGGGSEASVESAKRQAGALGDSLKVLAIDVARRALDGLSDARAEKATARSEPETPRDAPARPGPAREEVSNRD